MLLPAGVLVLGFLSVLGFQQMRHLAARPAAPAVPAPDSSAV
jgi:hypothetical protein